MAIQYLTLDDFEVICDVLTNFFSQVKDPPPDYRKTYFEKLDSIIAIPRKTFDKNDLYPSLYHKAACYLYFTNKIHPFNNGNKRISIVATGVFLRYNKHELNVDQELLYSFAKEVTEQHASRDEEFEKVVSFVREHSANQQALSYPNLAAWLQQLFRKK